MYKTISTEVDVDIDLEDFGTDELLEELHSRGISSEFGDSSGLLTAIWLKRRVGRKDYETELDQLIYYGLGRVI